MAVLNAGAFQLRCLWCRSWNPTPVGAGTVLRCSGCGFPSPLPFPDGVRPGDVVRVDAILEFPGPVVRGVRTLRTEVREFVLDAESGEVLNYPGVRLPDPPKGSGRRGL